MRTIKSYGHIVNKQFKVNRKRNISTVSGIILSIILFTIVGYIQTYFEYENILDAKTRNGNYEVVLTDLSSEQIIQLKNNILTKDVGLYTEVYDSTIRIGDKEKNIQVYAVDNVITKNLFSNLINLKSGVLPTKDNEILIDTLGKDFLHKDIGDTLRLDNKEYTIVGTYDKINSNQPYTIEILTHFNKESNLDNINAAFNVMATNNKVEMIKKISRDIGVTRDENIKFNNLIFDYYNIEGYQGINQENTTQFLLYCSILVLTVFMTYGSINISLKERIQQFSILRCIGATPSKIRVLLIRESFLLGIFSIIPGLILGQIICFLIYSVILQNIFTTKVPFKLYPNVIITVVLLSVINIILSTIIPVIKIGKLSPIEGIRNSGEINKTVKMRNSKILGKAFGYNGLLAYKNIRGNNRSFLITTITSIMILTTFIVFFGYTKSLTSSFNNEQINGKDLSLDIDTKYKTNYEDVFEELDKYREEIEDLGVTNQVFGRVEYFISGIFEGVQLNKNIKQEDYNGSIGEKNIYIDGKASSYSDLIYLLVLDDNSLEDVLSNVKDNKVTVDDFKENGVLILNRIVLKNLFTLEKEPIFNLNINDKFTMKLDEIYYEENNKNLYEKSKDLLNKGKEINFKYLGSVDIEETQDLKRFGEMTTLIVSEDFYNNNKDLFIRKNNRVPIESERISFQVNLKENMNRETALRTIENYINKIEGFYIDNESSNWNIERQIIIISSMVYLVLFLTIIVGGLNLINNKNISIKLRGKEIGALLAIGINKKRLKKILMLEAIMQWFISMVISLILSYSILTIIYKVMVYTNQMSEGQMPILATIFGCVILLIVNILGSYLPIRKLEYTNTTELIKNQE